MMASLDSSFGLEFSTRRFRISPVLLLALIFWASAALTYYCLCTAAVDASVESGKFFCAGAGAVFLASASAAGVALRRQGPNAKTFMALAAVAMVFLGLGCALGAVCKMQASENAWEQLSSEGSAQRNLRFFVAGDSQEGAYGSWADCLVFTPETGVAKIRVQADKDAVWYYGELVGASVKLACPGSAQQGLYATKGLVGKAQVISMENVSWLTPFAERRAEFIETVAGGEGSSPQVGLLLALACGYRGLLQESALYRDFQIAGLAHIVAVSGAHLSLMVAFATLLLSRLKVKRKNRIALLLLFTGAFLFLCAFPLSAFRAAFMSVLGCMSFFAKRRAASQNALGLCIFACIVFDPSTALSVSFTLSALSTLGILVLSPLFKEKVRTPRSASRASGIRSTAVESIILTLSASIATLPLSAALFSQVSLVMFLSNMVLGVLFTPLCLSALACQLFFVCFGFILPVLLAFARGMCLVFSLLVHGFASVPYAALPVNVSVGWALATSVLCFAVVCSRLGKRARGKAEGFSGGKAGKGKKKHWLAAGAAIAFLLVLVFRAQPSTPYLSALDVGQGDALLVKDASCAVLVDMGNQDGKLKKELARKGIYRLDALFITHPDDDHCGSVEALASVVEVKRVYVPQGMIACPCAKCEKLKERLHALDVSLEGVEVGDTFSSDHCTIAVAWPYAYTAEGGNQDSLCLRVTVDCDLDNLPDYSALLVGDAESETLAAPALAQDIEKADIFKVGHHGSAVSCSEEVLDKINPRIALLSVGAHNRYGHPSDQTLLQLQEKGAIIARTDQQGTITCFFENEGIRLAADR